MSFLHSFDPFGSRQKAEHSQVIGPLPLQPFDRRNRGISRSQHGVDRNHQTLIQLGGHLEVILDRFQRFLVPVKTDETDSGRRNDLKKAIEQPVACPKNRDQSQFLAVDHGGLHPAEGSVETDCRKGQVSSDLIGQKHGSFPKQLTESCARSFLASHQAQLVLNQGVIDNR